MRVSIADFEHEFHHLDMTKGKGKADPARQPTPYSVVK